MKFTESPLKGVWLVDLEPISDDRGFFSRSFCHDEFTVRGMRSVIAQCNVSYNRTRGTIRGMHYQHPPMAEAKLVRCTRGALYDVVIDLRHDSDTFCRWFAVELTGDNHRSLYIPEGFAHGFQTLEDDTEVFYQMFERFSPQHAAGVRWDDPVFSIAWPLPGLNISDKDRSYPLFAGPGL